jgi:hypothetical protein
MWKSREKGQIRNGKKDGERKGENKRKEVITQTVERGRRGKVSRKTDVYTE